MSNTLLRIFLLLSLHTAISAFSPSDASFTGTSSDTQSFGGSKGLLSSSQSIARSISSSSAVPNIRISTTPKTSPKAVSKTTQIKSTTAKTTSAKITTKTGVAASQTQTNASAQSSSQSSARAYSSAVADDYTSLNASTKQSIAQELVRNYAYQISLWNFQWCTLGTSTGYYCQPLVNERRLQDISSSFRASTNYDTFGYDLYTSVQYPGLGTSDIQNENLTTSAITMLLSGCLGNITCQTAFANMPNTYSQIAADVIAFNGNLIINSLSNNGRWIPDATGAYYTRRFLSIPDWSAEIFGIHSALPLSLMSGYFNNTVFGKVLQMRRIMDGAPQRIEDSINTLIMLSLKIPDTANPSTAILDVIYQDPVRKKRSIDWFNIDPTALLHAMSKEDGDKYGPHVDSEPFLAVRDLGTGLGQVQAICKGIGLATSFMSIRGFPKRLSTLIRTKSTISTGFNNVLTYASSESLLLGSITGTCAQSGSTCYGGSTFWHITALGEDATHIVTGYLGVAAAATALAGTSGVAATTIAGVEVGLNTLNFACGMVNFAADAAMAIQKDCQNSPSLPECTALQYGCLVGGAITTDFGVD